MSVFVITGASQGIGRATALAFAALPDAKLALISRNRDALEATADQCRAAGATAVVFPCDVTDEPAVGRVADQVLTSLGVPAAVVNIAGTFRPGPLLETDLDSFREQIDSNAVSAFIVSRAFLPALIAKGAGHLFFMGSVASLRAYPGSVGYCAGKHALLGLARVIREETRAAGLRVTVLLPGATWTPSWDGVDLPEERFMPPEDVARILVETYGLSHRSVVEEIVLRPQLGDL